MQGAGGFLHPVRPELQRFFDEGAGGSVAGLSVDFGVPVIPDDLVADPAVGFIPTQDSFHVKVF